MKRYEMNEGYSTIIAENIAKVICVAILMAALIYDAKMIILLCVCVLTLSFGAKIWAKASLNKLELILKTDTKRAFPGDNINAIITVRNMKFLPVWVKAEIPESLGTMQTKEAGLLSYSNLEHEWYFSYEKRGVYNIGPLNLAAGDLLGFYSIKRNYPDTNEIIVYPKLVSLEAKPWKSKEYFGNQKSREFVMDPVQIIGTREYTSGQPAKNIHWKASAKTGNLHEKVFEPSAHIKIMLVVDVRGFKEAEAFDEFEAMLSNVATTAVELSKARISPGLILNGVMIGDNMPIISPDEGTDFVYRILEKMARLTIDINEQYDKNINQRAFKDSVSYIYFCYHEDERIISLEKSNKAIEVIACELERGKSA